MKVVYVIDSLANKGGAERIILNKMEYMATHFGYDMSIIACYQNEQTPNFYPVPEQITQYKLAVPYYSQYKYHYPYRLLLKRRLRHQFCKRVKETVQTIDPDILIGVSYFGADVVTSIPCRAKKLVEVHEPRPFTLSNYGLCRGRLSNWYMKHFRDWYFKRVEAQADLVVTLTPGDAHEWRKAKRVLVIPNFTVMPVERVSDVSAKRVIAAGRLEWVKGYDRLIPAWKIVSDKHPDWHLDIFGLGMREQDLKQQQESLGLQERMTIHPATSAIGKEYSASSIFALSSRFEGFGLVLLEAMQCGLPCVAYDCPFGPAAIVKDGQNGFLVPEGDIEQLAEKLLVLIEDDDMRRRFSKAAVEHSKKFTADEIMLQWKQLFEELTNA